MTVNSPLTRTIVSYDSIEVLCVGGSVVSGSSAVFSGSAGIVGVTQNVVEVLARPAVPVYVSTFIIELLVNLNGLAETSPVPETGTYGYAFVT